LAGAVWLAGIGAAARLRAEWDAASTAAIGARADALFEEGARAEAPFDEKELAKIYQHSPLRDPPPDPTNARADDPRAARLGQWLFFDKRLSANGELACASCHDPRLAFADGKPLAQGLGLADRNAPALWNAAWQRWYFWDGRADSLWAQALQPIENAVEMGGNRASIAHLFQRDERLRAAYEALFGALPDLTDAQRFPKDARPDPARPEDPLERAWSSMSAEDRAEVDRVFANTGKALEAYVRRIQSRHSPFDRFVAALRAGDAAEQARYPEAARRGLALFVGKANCRSCHAGANFTDDEFHNIGVPSRAGVDGDPSARRSPLVEAGRRAGLERARKDSFNAAGPFSDDREGARASELGTLVQSSESFGQFKTPSLRNVALTAPYMHQGQLATLADVLRYYSTLDGAVPAGHHGEQVIKPLHLAPQEIDDLIAFLQTLSDTELPRGLEVPPSSPLATSDAATAR
jgi:cytochrome c peroxidase